jgi:hypothetical protein
VKLSNTMRPRGRLSAALAATPNGLRPRIALIPFVVFLGFGSFVLGPGIGSAAASEQAPEPHDPACFTYPSETHLAAVGLSAVAGSACPAVNVADAHGNASFDAVPPPSRFNAPIVGIAAFGTGYWLAGTDGGVFALAGNQFYGSAQGLHLNAHVVGVAATPDGQGYYLVASDGGVFAFGDAVFQGSMAGHSLAAPIVGMAVDPRTGGYVLVGADGGVFAFGTPFYGSMSGQPLQGAIVGVAVDSNTGGYWHASSDGGVFALGAPFWGARTGESVAPIVGISALRDDYFLVDADGNISDLEGPQPTLPPGGLPSA